MPLKPEDIQRLLKEELEKPTRGSKSKVDTTIRDYRTWFKLATSMIEEGGEPIKCENPNCQDPRPGDLQVCATINNRLMCRFCFLDGWLLNSENQMRME